MGQNEEHVNRTFCAIQMEAVSIFVQIQDLKEMERAEEHATRAKHATVMVPVEVSNYGDFRNKVYFFEYLGHS